MTVLLAILLALGVPFAQLPTVNDRITCCCPSPEVCKCPDHKSDQVQQATMGVCHKSGSAMVRTQLAAFVPPAIVRLIAPARPAAQIEHVLPAPHAQPPPRRPDAPS